MVLICRGFLEPMAHLSLPCGALLLLQLGGAGRVAVDLGLQLLDLSLLLVLLGVGLAELLLFNVFCVSCVSVCYVFLLYGLSLSYCYVYVYLFSSLSQKAFWVASASASASSFSTMSLMRSFTFWLRTNGVSTTGAAAKVMNFDRFRRKVSPGSFGKIKVSSREYQKSPPCQTQAFKQMQ